MLEIEDIYSLLPEGTFSNIEAFKNYVETAGIESIYPAIPEGTFSSEEAFVKLYKKKKKLRSPFRKLVLRIHSNLLRVMSL